MKKIGVEVGSEAPREFYSCIVHIKIIIIIIRYIWDKSYLLMISTFTKYIFTLTPVYLLLLLQFDVYARSFII